MQDHEPVSAVEYASFSRRLVAFLLDIIPITLFFTFLFYTFLGFDTTYHRYLEAGPGDHEARRAFLEERNLIRAVAGFAFLLYATQMHASLWQATLGKKLMNIRVVDHHGEPIGWRQSLQRSMAMMLSILPAFIGCLAMLWSKTNQAWHDKLAGTYVVKGKAHNHSSLEWEAK